MTSTDREEDTAEEMAEEIVRAVSSEDQGKGDGLTEREREIELRREEERRRKGEELRKRLKARGVGIVTYRWPAFILLVAAMLSVWSEFSVVMVHPPGVGFDTFYEVFVSTGSPFFVLPLVAGGLFVVLAVLAYRDPRATYLSLIPGLMTAMGGSAVYYLVSFANSVSPDVGVYATGTPLTMYLVAALSLLAIAMRERL